MKFTYRYLTLIFHVDVFLSTSGYISLFLPSILAYKSTFFSSKIGSKTGGRLISETIECGVKFKVDLIITPFRQVIQLFVTENKLK